MMALEVMRSPEKTDSFPTKEKKGIKKTSQYRRCKKKKTVARRRSGSRRLIPSAVDEQGCEHIARVSS